MQLELITTSILLCIAVIGIFAGIAMILFNAQRDWNRGKHEPMESADPIASLSLKITKAGLIMLVFSAIGFGIALWNLVNDTIIVMEPKVSVLLYTPTVSAALYTPWFFIIIAIALVAGWSVVARSIHVERTRPKLITQDNVMGNETRSKIMVLVENCPGIHFSRMKTMLGLSPRTIRDQLHVLLSFGKISAVTIDGKKSYFTPSTGYLDDNEKQSWLSMLTFFRRGGKENLLRAILRNPGASFMSIVNATSEPRSTIRRKLNTLEQRKYVSITRMGDEMVSIDLVPSVEKFARQIIHDE